MHLITFRLYMYICVDEMHMTSFVIIYSSWFPACLFGINIKTGVFFLKINCTHLATRITCNLKFDSRFFKNNPRYTVWLTKSSHFIKKGRFIVQNYFQELWIYLKWFIAALQIGIITQLIFLIFGSIKLSAEAKRSSLWHEHNYLLDLVI